MMIVGTDETDDGRPLAWLRPARVPEMNWETRVEEMVPAKARDSISRRKLVEMTEPRDHDEADKPFDQMHSYVVDAETMKSAEAMTHVVVTCERCGEWRITKKGKSPKCNMTPKCTGKMTPPPDLARRPTWNQVLKRGV